MAHFLYPSQILHSLHTNFKSTSNSHPPKKPQAKYLIYNVLFTNISTFCEIKIEERGALSTKYVKTSFAPLVMPLLDPAVKLLEQL
jgi:hypothetical protein